MKSTPQSGLDIISSYKYAILQSFLMVAYLQNTWWLSTKCF